MVAMASDNVIRFPEAGRAPVAGFDRTQTLLAARDLVAQKLRESWRNLLPALEEELNARGDVAGERERRAFYYAARETVRDNALRLEGLLAAHWLKKIDEATRRNPAVSLAVAEPGLDELTLVGFGDMDEELAAKSLASRMKDACEEGLFAAGRRIGWLSGRGEESVGVESVLAESLRAALTEVGIDAGLRIELLRWFEARALERFSSLVHDLNTYLVGRNVLPKLRRSFARTDQDVARKGDKDAGQDAPQGDVFALLQRLVGGAAAAGEPGAGGSGAPHAGLAGAAGTLLAGPALERVMASLDLLQGRLPVMMGGAPNANVLRDFRTSDAGQELGHLDAVTVDIVATLFDFIFDDPAIADPIKALVARLQIPVLKVAMLDKAFFSSKAHPARHLLDVISRAASRCGPHADNQDPLYARISEIIERLQQEFRQDTSLFDTLCHDLEGVLQQQELAADEHAARAAPLVVAEEQRQLAGLAADQALAGWLAMPLPEIVTALLDREWRALLVRRYLESDTQGWDAAVALISDLVISVQPQADARGRKQLAAKLPSLVKAIHDSLNLLKVPDDRRLVLIDALFSLHAAVLRGATPVVMERFPAAPEPQPVNLASERIEESGLELENITLAEGCVVETADQDIGEKVANLQRGDWVEFSAAGEEPVRYRLSWISPQRGIFLFTNPASPRALSVAPEALAVQIERGEAAIVAVEPIFDRAVNRALEALKAA